jgi:hypothetical protein
MCVADTRHGECTREINHLSAIACYRGNIIGRSNGDELAILDGHRFSPGLSFVHRVDLAVGVNGVGDLGARLCDRRRSLRDLGRLHFL